ncbi:MAG: hypothetical protein H7296_08130 [Bacteroidia bacterium]|nr:hypothetical protein [Bacteroidia bacterium]
MEIFSSMPNNARTWIYAANRQLSSAEEHAIQAELTDFVQSWTAHERALKAEAAILYNQFVVIMVDEAHSEISGCGIDKSVQLIKTINNKYQLDFFNRLAVQTLTDNQVTTYNKKTLQEAINAGILTGQTIAFNPLVQHKSDFLSNWLQPLQQNWISKQIVFLVQA